jgi:hypothetical protein
MEMIWTATVEEDSDGELCIVFPPESIEGLGWQPGDSIVWSDIGNGAWSLKKVEE